MVALVAILAGIALVMAVVVTALIIGICLAIAWITDTIRASRERSRRGTGGGGGARAATLPSAGGGRRDASGMPVSYRRPGR
jgi:MFS superfamily sulfate permease-like transporter